MGKQLARFGKGAITYLVVGRKNPAWQGVHSVDPSFAAYDPVKQFSHSSIPPIAANVPIGHGFDNALEFAPVASRNVPFGVGSHWTAPERSLNVPTGHASHRAAPGNAAYVPNGEVGQGTQFSTELEPSFGR